MTNMIDFSELFNGALFDFTLAYAICVVTPGPDFALNVRNSIMYSRRAGMFTALGTSCGLTVHATYSLIGPALILRESEYAFLAIKILGALYLGYLGISAILKKPAVLDKLAQIEKDAKAPHEGDLTAFQAFRMGFLTDALNPFAVVFF